MNSERAATFDRMASAYDRAHTGYPEALADEILALSGVGSGGRILEIGSGSGHAAMPFARRGIRMTCLEPGANLAAVARGNLADCPGVEVLQTTFEDWPLEPESFDLVISARALHWVDPRVRFEKTANALRPAGWLAVFHNMEIPGRAPVDLAIRGLIDEAMPRPPLRRGRKLERQFAHAPHFGPLIKRKYRWRHEFDAAAYAGRSEARLDFHDLSAEKRSSLIFAIKGVIEELGGTISVEFETRLAMACRRRGPAWWRRLTRRFRSGRL